MTRDEAWSNIREWAMEVIGRRGLDVLVDRGSEFPRLPYQTVNDQPLSDRRMKARFYIRVQDRALLPNTKEISAAIESLRRHVDNDRTLGGRFASDDELALEFRELGPPEPRVELTVTVSD